jgi:FkbM family methyltransferase
VKDPAQFVSYAQHGEDVILWRALGDRDGGLYVDVGAFHPSDHSVTRALYERGWRGINIEPQPERLEAFQRERPEDTNLSLAIGDSDGTATLMLPENPGWASLLDPSLTGSDTTTLRRLQVPIRRLDTLLPELGVERVDILKIDVEGVEPAVVRGFIESPIRPLVCVVEGVAPGVGRAAGDEAVALLVAAGYQHCLFDGLNHYLTTDPALQPALSTPANPIDGYQTDLVDRLLRERHDLHSAIAALASENLGLRAVPAPAAAAEPEQVPADSTQTPPEDSESADGDGQTASASSDLPLPSPEVMSAVAPTPQVPAFARQRGDLDPVLRTRRRRATFARLLQVDPTRLPRLATEGPLAHLLTLAVTDPAPIKAISVLYQAILGREADPDGLAAWSSRLELGHHLLDLARELADSSEARGLSRGHRARILSDLTVWESLVALTELGVPAWHVDRPYTSGAVAHEIFVGALYEVALQRRPSPAEARIEIAKLVGGTGRERLLRAFAARPEVKVRLLGNNAAGLRGRLSRARAARHHVETFRMLVVAAEGRQVTQLLAGLPAAASMRLQDAARLSANTSEGH